MQGSRCEVLIILGPMDTYYSLPVAMDTFEVESCVRGQSLHNYIISVHFMCVELILVGLNLVIY